MNQSSAQPPEPAYEEILVQAIGLLEREDPSGPSSDGRGVSASIEALLAAHPSHAARLRVHLSRLHELGFAVHDRARESTPTRVGDFRIVRRLGSGGMGVVYLAHQESLGRDVALKLVHLEYAHLPAVRERFRREVRTIARLQHPGIVPVFDAGEDAGVPWLAMEPVVGAPLDAVMRQLLGRDPATLHGRDLRQALLAAMPADVPVPTDSPGEGPFAAPWPSACLQLVRAIAGALHHAHQQGVLHRDLKPSNIMLTPAGRVLLLDFGLAVAAGDARLTRSGSQLGTLAYMAPEQLRGGADAVDARADVYSLGVTAIELLTLQLPFAADSDVAIRERILAGQLPRLRQHNRAVPRDVELVLRKACDVDRGRRYADAGVFAEDLGNLLELRPIRAQPAGAWLTVRRWLQRHPARATAIAAAILLFLVAPTAFLLQAQAANRDIRLALDTANEQRRRAGEQRDLARAAVDSLLERVANEDLLELPRMQRVRRDLLERARSFYERFLAADPDDLLLLEQTARATLHMVFVEGDLGQVDLAKGTADRAVELATQLRERRPDDDDDVALLLADALLSRGRVHLTSARPGAAEADLDGAATIVHEVLGRQPAQPLAIVHLLGIERGRSLAMQALGRRAEREAALRRLDELWVRGGEATVGHPYRDVALSVVLCSGVDETRFLLAEGRLDEARAACERTEALAAAVAAEPLPVAALVALASLPVLRAQFELGGEEGDQRERRMRECLARTEIILVDHPELIQALRIRANVENALGLLLGEDPARADEAASWVERAVSTQRSLVAADPSVPDNRANLAASLVNIGSHHLDAGDHGEALRSFAEAEQLAAAVTALAPDNPRWCEYHYNATWFLGQTHGQLRDHAAQAEAARRLARHRPDDGKTHRIVAELLAEASSNAAGDARLSADERARLGSALADEALQQLESAADRGYADVDRLRTGGKLAPLRELPGFAAVLQRVAANADAAR